MIRYFPEIYEDEVLHSIVARYIQHMQIFQGHGAKDLYGKAKGTLIDTPNNLKVLVESIACPGINENRIIFNHTLFSFYTAFHTDFERSRTFEQMISNENGKGIRREAGIISDISPPKTLRFCPSCVAEDIDKRGEPYWHRVHQVPGVLVCPTHGEHVLDRCGECGEVFTFAHRKYLALPFACTNGHRLDINIGSPKPVNNQLYAHLVEYAEDVKYLFESQLCFQPGVTRKIYHERLQEIGLCLNGECVDNKNLINKFSNFYGADYLMLMQSDLQYVKGNNCWLMKLCRPSDSGRIPALRHLLLIRFLFESLKNFVAIYNNYGITNDHGITDKKKPKQQTCKNLQQNEIDEVRRTAFRKIIASFLRNNPGAPRTEVKKAHWYQYTTLAKLDREWMESNLPRPMRPIGRKKINWKERDKALSCKVQHAIKVLLNKIPIERVTKRKIGIITNDQYNIINNLSNLPNTQRIIQQSVESLSEYKKRIDKYHSDHIEEISCEWFIDISLKVERSMTSLLCYKS
jgi:hypothetical protein